MPIFARPNAAFFAYEAYLQTLPRRMPLTRTDAPNLWERAKAMFAIMVQAITSAAHLTQRTRFSLTERRDLRTRLVPLEKLVRVLLIIEAATHLLMTPEGRKLRAETPKVTPPAPTPPVGAAKPQLSTRIVMPGWHTIAALRPCIDPRVVEREQREALERRLAETEDETPTRADEDPTSWRCRFSVLHWVHHDDVGASAKPKASGPRPRLMTFDGMGDDSHYPILPGMKLAPASRSASSDNHDDGDAASLNHGRDLARRIEALARVLANPMPAIRRLARRLAALAPEDLTDPSLASVSTLLWPHAAAEYRAAMSMLDPALYALAATHKHDPG